MSEIITKFIRYPNRFYLKLKFFKEPKLISFQLFIEINIGTIKRVFLDPDLL